MKYESNVRSVSANSIAGSVSQFISYIAFAGSHYDISPHPKLSLESAKLVHANLVIACLLSLYQMT